MKGVLNELFDGLQSQDEREARFDLYKTVMADCIKDAREGVARGEIQFGARAGGQGKVLTRMESPAAMANALVSRLSKGYSGDQVAGVIQALQQVEQIQKDWTITNPLNTVPYGEMGLVPYSLDPALAMLVPRSLIHRNSTARITSQGEAHEYRRILGVTNSGTGGVANRSISFSSATVSDTFGSVTLNRPKKIGYAADRVVKSFVEMGISDSASMQAQFAGQGFVDIRQLSHTAAMWAHLLGEERELANARSTALDVSGVSGSAASVDSSVTGSGLPSLTGAAIHYTFASSMGETDAISAEASLDTTAGEGVAVTYTGNQPVGALGIAVYVTKSGTTYRGFTAIATGAGAASPTSFVVWAAGVPAADASYSATSYDGFISTFTDPTLSTVLDLNAVLSDSEVGADFQELFGTMYGINQANPDVLYMAGGVRRALAKQVQAQGTPNGYRFEYQTGADGITVGGAVVGIQNETTDKFLDIIVHPYYPLGVVLAHSLTLPFADSGVTQTARVVNVQDLLVLEWPVMQLSYDLSTYQYGTVEFPAPAWSGAITNIVTN
jgi:hypothetical protein